MAIFDVIRYEGGNDILVWKHPCEDFNTNAKLSVLPTQEAVVVANGKWILYMGGEEYLLENENIPFVRRAKEFFTGGMQENHYEVYFINKVLAMPAYWGTSQPWKIQDPRLQVPFNMRASGSYFIKVEDSISFIQNIIGTTTSFTTRSLNTYFRDLLLQNVKTCITKFLYEKKMMFTQLNENLPELSQLIQNSVMPVFEKRGLLIEDFSISHLDVIEDEIFEEARKAMLEFYKKEKREHKENDKSEVAFTVESNYTIKCPGCGRQISESSHACKYCGTKINMNSDKIVCPHCGSMIDADSIFCSVCSKRI